MTLLWGCAHAGVAASQYMYTAKSIFLLITRVYSWTVERHASSRLLTIRRLAVKWRCHVNGTGADAANRVLFAGVISSFSVIELSTTRRPHVHR